MGIQDHWEKYHYFCLVTFFPERKKYDKIIERSIRNIFLQISFIIVQVFFHNASVALAIDKISEKILTEYIRKNHVV